MPKLILYCVTIECLFSISVCIDCIETLISTVAAQCNTGFTIKNITITYRQYFESEHSSKKLIIFLVAWSAAIDAHANQAYTHVHAEQHN